MACSLHHNKIVIFLIVFSVAVSMVVGSFGGSTRKLMGEPSTLMAKDMTMETIREVLFQDMEEEEEEEEVTRSYHARVLKVNTNDYGRADPAPALQKPPSKLIPN